MPNVTLSVSEELKREMESMPEINWSEIVRELLSEKVRRMAVLKKLDESLRDSKLSEGQALKLGEELKGKMFKKYKQRGW